MPDAPNQPDIERLAQEYEARRSLQEQFTLRLVELLKNLLETARAEFHLIEHRTKSVASYREKLSRNSKSYTAPLKEVTDLTGIRIILYYEDDLPEILYLIEREFWVDQKNSHDSHDSFRPEEFGYQSKHYIVKLPQQRLALAEWRRFENLNAEIQVRTVLQHAWAAISHKIQYKKESDIPSPLRRRLFRLSALLELADQEFLSLKNETTILVEKIEQKLSGGDQNISVDIFSVEEYLRSSPDVSTLVTRAEEAGFSFDPLYTEADSENSEDKAISDLVDLAKHLGFQTISDINRTINVSLTISKAFFSNQLDEAEKESDGNRDWYISPAFACILILIGLYANKVTIKYLASRGWSEDIARTVLKTSRAFKLWSRMS